MDEKSKKELTNLLNSKLEQGFDELGQRIDKKFEENFIKMFNKGFEEVVAPVLEEIEDEMKDGFKMVNSRLDNINRRLDTEVVKVADHEKRIKRLESKRAAV